MDDALCYSCSYRRRYRSGGGVAYICFEATGGLKGDNEDETTGIEIIKRAIEEPLRQIVANAEVRKECTSSSTESVREGKG